MKKEFEITDQKDNNVEKETFEIEIRETDIVFFMWKKLKDDRQIYNKTILDKREFMDFMEEAT